MRVFSLFVLLVLTSVARPAAAFCGFFVSGSDQKLVANASQVVLMRKGNRTVMTMSNTYQGPAADFAMVIPVPVVLKKDQVKTLAPSVFKHIEQLTAPRLVEYWEQDPCEPVSPKDDTLSRRGDAMPMSKARVSRDEGEAAQYHVKIEAQFTRGEYEIVVLSAEDSQGLDGWLRANHYNIPVGAEEAMRPYIQSQQKFFVAKVDVKKVKLDGKQQAVLSPLQFSFESPELRLPVRLGLLNSGTAQDLLVYVLHQTKRFEVANYKNVFIPTNLELTTAAKKMFHAFYAAMFDETLRRNNNRAVVTEYAWDTASCDPCPGPTLDPREIATLGANRLGDSEGSWVVTRLHTRYSHETLSEDLLFRIARPMAGGRAERADGGGPQVAKVDPVNNFQGRYVVRHYWPKKLTCEQPQRGVWGGPPDGRSPSPSVAMGNSEAPPAGIQLEKLVRGSAPALGIGKRSSP